MTDPRNSIDLPVPAETTLGGIDHARQALAESKQANTDSNAIIRDAAEVLEVVRQFERENGYTRKFRAIIQGSR